VGIRHRPLSDRRHARWSDDEVQQRLGAWVRVARAWHDWQGLKVARLGDNMRQVSVTEGDKVEAQLRFGYSVNGYGLQ